MRRSLLTNQNFCKSNFHLSTSSIFWKRIFMLIKKHYQGCHSFCALKIEEIWGGITNIFEEICQNLAQNLRRIEEISHMYVLVDLTFTDVMSSNITVYSRRNTTLTVGKKSTFNMKLLYYMCMNKHFISLISVSVQD